MITATIRIAVPNKTVGSSLVRAVGPDNLNMQGLTVKAKATTRAATFDVVFNGKIETFISTLDDLLRCLQAAKATIDKIIE